MDNLEWDTRMYKVILLFMTLLTTSAHSAEIADFKFGLACTDAKTFGWICHELDRIYITGQSECVFDGEKKPCTWYGYSFQYKDFTESDVINCKFENSESARIGNPWETLSESTSNGEYNIDVGVGTGVFFNPQYSVLTIAENTSEASQFSRSVCTLNGEEIIDFSYEKIYPVRTRRNDK